MGRIRFINCLYTVGGGKGCNMGSEMDDARAVCSVTSSPRARHDDFQYIMRILLRILLASSLFASKKPTTTMRPRTNN